MANGENGGHCSQCTAKLIGAENLEERCKIPFEALANRTFLLDLDNIYRGVMRRSVFCTTINHFPLHRHGKRLHEIRNIWFRGKPE